ncbi:hypothetical protein V1505DRAFT_359284 [Lipomyces doorenjongii]
MAQGTMFNIEMANNDSSAEDWLHLSELALTANSASNGASASLDKGRRGDNAWPLWGLVMRLIPSDGYASRRCPLEFTAGCRRGKTQGVLGVQFCRHIPGTLFLKAVRFIQTLPVIELILDRCAINPEHCDTAFPIESLNLNGEKSYSILRFELSQLSSEFVIIFTSSSVSQLTRFQDSQHDDEGAKCPPPTTSVDGSARV